MKFRYVALGTGVLLAGGLALFLAPVFNQPREKSGVANTSPEYLAKREVMRASMEQGRSLLAAGKGAEAEAAFRKAQQVFPTAHNIDADAGIGEALYLQGKPQEAVTAYRRALSTAPGAVDLLLKYGRMCDRAGQPEEALLAYRRAFALQGKGTGFPVELSEKASDAEVREKAAVAIRTYQQGAPDWQVKLDRELAGK